MVTGSLGGSILGKHLTFTPRVREALRLHELVDLHAMIDISDGLAADLHHICQESGCGAELEADAIPVSVDACRMADARPPLDHALGDGEDFELLFAVDAADGCELLRASRYQALPLPASAFVSSKESGCVAMVSGKFCLHSVMSILSGNKHACSTRLRGSSFGLRRFTAANVRSTASRENLRVVPPPRFRQSG